MRSEKNRIHIVDASPWRLVVSVGVLALASSIAKYLHGTGSTILVIISLTWLGLSVGIWCRDIIREGTYEGQHTSIVQSGIRLGIMLFIASEVSFFVSIILAIIWGVLNGGVELGGVYRPKGIYTINEWDIPLLNTILLLLSGASATWGHHGLVVGSRFNSLLGLGLTVVLGLLITLMQLVEYNQGSIGISDGVYGSSIYLLTGIHGFHVVMGTLMLFVGFMRVFLYEQTKQHHYGLESSIYYWHIVDVIWLIVYVLVYVWGK